MTKRIYDSSGGGYPVYSVDGNYIYNGTGGGYPVYTIEDNDIFNNSSSTNNTASKNQKESSNIFF